MLRVPPVTSHVDVMQMVHHHPNYLNHAKPQSNKQTKKTRVYLHHKQQKTKNDPCTLHTNHNPQRQQSANNLEVVGYDRLIN